MLARYKRWQLVVVGWSTKRKAIGFFGHVTEQASGLRETRVRLTKAHLRRPSMRLQAFAMREHAGDFA
jgi:hypothetical protein